MTTAAEIAARAGVTERTFFRHFPDKREVLFDGEAGLTAALIEAVAKAPLRLGPWPTLFRAFRSAEPIFVANRAFAQPRQRVIAGSPALQERELAKVASLTAALAGALRHRGVEDGLAILAAQAGMAALSHAVTSWLDDSSSNLDEQLVRSFEGLRALSSSAIRQARG